MSILRNLMGFVVGIWQLTVLYENINRSKEGMIMWYIKKVYHA
jgi:hypothetical protein